MELSKKKIKVSVTAPAVFDAQAACSILSLAFSGSGKYRFGKWCESVSVHNFDMEGHEDLWLVIPCGGTLRFRYAGDTIADLDLDDLAAGFTAWYEAGGFEHVPLRMNAEHELIFDPYGLSVQHPEQIDAIIQWSLFGYLKYPQETQMHVAVVMGSGGGKKDLEQAIADHFAKKEVGVADDDPKTGCETSVPKIYRCSKCVKERLCENKRPNCNDFVRDPPDGGFYG